VFFVQAVTIGLHMGHFFPFVLRVKTVIFIGIWLNNSKKQFSRYFVSFSFFCLEK